MYYMITRLTSSCVTHYYLLLLIGYIYFFRILCYGCSGVSYYRFIIASHAGFVYSTSGSGLINPTVTHCTHLRTIVLRLLIISFLVDH